jgi:hypothetical protein
MLTQQGIGGPQSEAQADKARVVQSGPILGHYFFLIIY